jgi:KaiC/GvpD/RAD55 family RecA-like ATPase
MKFYRTFIKGFDEELENGIPEGHIVLISGHPGTMKSSLVFNILYNHAKEEGVPGMYVTLEQPKKSLEFHMKRLGLDPADVSDKLSILDLSKVRKGVAGVSGDAPSVTAGKPWLNVLIRHLEDIKQSSGSELMAIDSLAVLEVVCGITDRRTELFYFFEWLRDLGVTTFLVSEVSPDPNQVSEEDFLADGIITVTMDRVGEVDVYRRIRCVKMRGVHHNTGVFTLEFRDGGFQVSQVI